MPYYGGGGTSLPVTDDTILVQNSADTSKQIRFDASSISTSTTRVYIMPNVDSTLAVISADNSFSTGQTLTSSDITDVTLSLHSITGQTANLTEWYDTAGSLAAWVDKDGVPNFSSFPVISGITQGSVLFGGAGGVITQDNTNLFWDDSSNLLTSNGVIVGNYTIAAKAPASGAGNSLTLRGSNAVSGNTNGGNIILTPGVKSGTGTDGQVQIKNGSGVTACYFTTENPTYPSMVLGGHKIHSYSNPAIMLFGTTTNSIFSINTDFFSGLGVRTSSFLGWCGSSTDAYGSLVAGFSSPGTNTIAVYGTSGTPGVLQGTNASGTNVTGIALNIGGGGGTGSAVGGDVNVQVSLAGTSGTTLRSLVTVAKFSPTTQHFQITNQANVIGQKIVIFNGQSVDAFQVLDYDGVTKYACVDASGNFSNAGSYANSEKFGASASVTSTEATAIGYGTSAALGCTALGYNANAASVASLALGYGSTTTASYQMVCGSASVPILNVFFNKGVTHTTPSTVTINGTGGSGTDIDGGGVNIAGGKGTGAGTPGSVNIQTSTAGVSSTTLQSLSTRLTVDGTGQVGIPSVVSGSQLSVTCSSASTVGVTVTGDASQTANLQTWKNNAGTISFGVNSQQHLQWTGTPTAPSNTSSARVLYDDGTYLRWKFSNVGYANRFLSFGGAGNFEIKFPGSSGYHSTEIYFEDQSNRKALSIDSSGNIGIAGVLNTGGTNFPLTLFVQSSGNVNGFRFTHASTGNPVTIVPNSTGTGGDANITLSLSGLGTGTVKSVAAGATSVGFTVQLASAATADAFQVLASDGVTKLAYITSTGVFTGDGSGLTGIVGGSSGQLQYNNSGAFGGLASTAVATSGNLITVTAQAATDVPLTLVGDASQTANLLVLKKGSTTVATVNSSGDVNGFVLSQTSSTSGKYGLQLNGSNFVDFYYAGTKYFVFQGSAFYSIQTSGSFGLRNAATKIFSNADGLINFTNSTNANGSGALYCGQPDTSTVGLRVQLKATSIVDLIQCLQSDGTTVIFKVNKDGNPTAKSTYFFEDANGYISRTSAGNTMSFSASSATDHMKLSGNYLDVLVSTALRLKAAADTTDGVVCAADKGGNSGTGLGLLLHGGNGSYSATPTAGGYIKVYGGDGAAGNTNGGAAYVFGGAKFGSGADGNVYLGYTGSAARGTVYTYGGLTFADANNIVFDTTTGTKIGTSTSQKIGFWNATPVVQQVLATGAGATVDDVINLLQTVGVCRQS